MLNRPHAPCQQFALKSLPKSLQGTGKTALAEDLDLPIFVYSLADMSNFSLMRNWMEMRASTPCIALIEDVDNVFHGRTNVAHGLHRDPGTLRAGRVALLLGGAASGGSGRRGSREPQDATRAG
jgi:hypothetical protein